MAAQKVHIVECEFVAHVQVVCKNTRIKNSGIPEWLDSDAATGNYCAYSVWYDSEGRAPSTYYFTDPDTAFAFKLRFG